VWESSKKHQTKNISLKALPVTYNKKVKKPENLPEKKKKLGTREMFTYVLVG